LSRNKKFADTLARVRKVTHFDFSKNTTYGLGGKAKAAYFPKNIKEVATVYDYLTKSGEKFLTLGNGSNVLVSDKGFDGSVIATKDFIGAYRTGENTFFCCAGTTVSSLLKYCLSHGFGGLEYLAGIPATVGGLCYMNGGVNTKHVGDDIVSVKIYDGKIRVLDNKTCGFGNKYSTMRDINCIILGAEFRFMPKSSTEIENNIAEFLDKRHVQPKGKSCGCVFKNCGGVSAGKIIQDAGLKGFNLGGATVSSDHANFIINNGGSSSDVYKLISEVKRKVFERTGIGLEEEVVYIGEFNDTFI